MVGCGVTWAIVSSWSISERIQKERWVKKTDVCKIQTQNLRTQEVGELCEKCVRETWKFQTESIDFWLKLLFEQRVYIYLVFALTNISSKVFNGYLC